MRASAPVDVDRGVYQGTARFDSWDARVKPDYHGGDGCVFAKGRATVERAIYAKAAVEDVEPGHIYFAVRTDGRVRRDLVCARPRIRAVDPLHREGDAMIGRARQRHHPV